MPKDLKIPVISVRTLGGKWGILLKPRHDQADEQIFQQQMPKKCLVCKKNLTNNFSWYTRQQNKSGVAVSRGTIRMSLKNNGLHGGVTRRKTLPQKCHTVSHLQYVRQYRDEYHYFWNKVIWIDDTKMFIEQEIWWFFMIPLKDSVCLRFCRKNHPDVNKLRYWNKPIRSLQSSGRAVEQSDLIWFVTYSLCLCVMFAHASWGKIMWQGQFDTLVNVLLGFQRNFEILPCMWVLHWHEPHI